ncbi:MAG: protease modulator HflC [Gammaproteobacteria bacterium]|nr:protease modulator HflC [Gammaproteobacteria bacterium]
MDRRMLPIVLVVVILVLLSQSVFTVSETEKAVRFRLGEIVDTDYNPGLHFKLPFVNNIRKFDSRIITLDATPEEFLTAEKKNLVVDSFVKWRINEVSNFYTSTGGSISTANLRLSQIIKETLKGEFGRRTIKEVVSGERRNVMDNLTKKTNLQAAKFGIQVVDVRLKRIDLSDKISDSVFQRMESERSRIAKDFRSKGAEAAERIRADADRQREIIKAEAYRDAERIRGDGDAKASELYANAYSANEEFYSLYRSLNAYKSTFSDKGDILVIDPSADFFKYFGQSTPR